MSPDPSLIQLISTVAAPVARTAMEAVLREVLDLQNAQTRTLTQLREDVQRLIDGPWRTAGDWLMRAGAPERTDRDRREYLIRARDKYFDARGLEAGPTLRRVYVEEQLTLVFGLLRDQSERGHWLRQAHQTAVDLTQESAKVHAIEFDRWGRRSAMRVFTAGVAASLGVQKFKHWDAAAAESVRALAEGRDRPSTPIDLEWVRLDWLDRLYVMREACSQSNQLRQARLRLGEDVSAIPKLSFVRDPSVDMFTRRNGRWITSVRIESE